MVDSSGMFPLGSRSHKMILVLPRVTPSVRPTLIPLGAGPFPQMFSLLATHDPQLGNSVAALHQPEALPLSPQTVATLSVLGTRRVVSILGVESQAVSLAACHLLQVIFDALKEGVKKGFRGKEGAIIVGEWKQVCGPLGVAVMEGKGRASQASSLGATPAAAGCGGIWLSDSILL